MSLIEAILFLFVMYLAWSLDGAWREIEKLEMPDIEEKKELGDGTNGK